MFVKQDDKLFVEKEGMLVGVKLTPTGFIPTEYKTNFVDGFYLTLDEVLCQYNEGYEFTVPEKEGECDDELGKVERDEAVTKRGRPRK